MTQPDVYFGEHLDGYVVVNTKRTEIDYQDAAGNSVPTNYTGSDGINMSSWIRRAAFALRFGDFNPLFSSNITPSSRIIINRDIYSRLNAIAPFLSWDADAYPVVIDGKVKWVVDGYTTTANYPYAQRAITDGGGGLSGRFNYVRNSVKAVIDAYDGTTTLYIVDHDDPIARRTRRRSRASSRSPIPHLSWLRTSGTRRTCSARRPTCGAGTTSTTPTRSTRTPTHGPSLRTRVRRPRTVRP